MDAAKIPATVITGFLGAGKTTLIRHLLENANGRRLALIVNEFGDVGVDGELLKSCGVEGCSEDDIVELANGCICCTVADDFIPTMEALLARDVPPDHIIIETSGLALPQPLIRAFNWPEIRTRVTVDGVVTLVDTAALAAGRFADDEAAVAAQRLADDMLDHETPLGELFEDQVSCADLVLMNKADLVSEAELTRIAARLRKEARDGVPVVPCHHGRLPLSVVLGIGAEAELDDRQSHHDREAAQGMADHDHDDFESFSLTFGELADPEAYLEQVARVIATHGILRLKGFAAVADRPMRMVIQAVGPRVDSYFDRDWRPDEMRRTELVVITLAGADKTAITQALSPN